MNISSGHDMDLIYDNKVYLPGDSSRLSQTYLAYVNRLDEKSRQTYWQFYDSLSREFYASKPTGRQLTE